MKTILFVCTENLFRSASAEFLFKKLLRDKEDESFNVISAGTKGTDPYGMYPMTKERIEFYGGNILGYRQEKLLQQHIDRADIIICMTHAHKNFVKNHFGVESYLFNELAEGKITDLEDDNEASGTYTNLTDFVYFTVDTIHEGLPMIYEKLLKMDL